MAPETIGVLFMAYGAAGSPEEVEPYLRDIRGGRPTPPALVSEIQNRYRQMGGQSPLLDITRGQAEATRIRLNEGGGHFKVYVGMRHWHPYINDAVRAMASDGIRKAVALCLTPYYSKLSVGAYYKKLDEALAETGASIGFKRVESWNDHPLLIEALAEKVRAALGRFPAEIRSKIPILFSAHSLPERILAEGDPYPKELQETVDLIMRKVGDNPRPFAYQSQGRTPEPWLGPDAAAVIRETAAKGGRHLVMAPIGFVSDHMETLYDVDILYRDICRAEGIQLERAESLNTSPGFIETLAAVVRENL